MSDLSVKYAGLEMDSPYIIGSGPISTDLNTIEEDRARKIVKKVADAGWAGIALKTVVHYESAERAGPYLWSPHNKMLPASLQNLGPWETKISEERLKKNIRIAKEAGLLVFGNVLGTSKDEWDSLCRAMEECEADAVELNVSCPHAGHELPLIGQDPSFLDETIRIAKKACSIPVIPKLPAIIHDIAAVANAGQAAGADAIAAVNTVPGLIGIDIETGIPIHRDISNNARYSGISGPLIKPIGLGYVAQMARLIDIPISGIGGIKDWKDAVEYIMVGATAVQICTEAMMQGFDMGMALVSRLRGFLDDKGYQRLDEIRGLSLKYIKTSMEEMETSAKAVSVIDPSLCTGCEACVTACADAVVEAIHMEEDIAVVDSKICVGCGLCGVVCPVDAVSFIKEG
ncbi:MAG: 4Fe-4S dicluster-binding protein [Candidatus Thorarchaeota archaeon]